MQSERSRAVLSSLEQFFETSLDDRLADSAEATAEERAIQLFHRAASQVPAYIRFLDQQGIRPEHVRSMDEFRRLPAITKANYLKNQRLPDLVWGGTLVDSEFVAVSSGSTGIPHFWPRSVFQEVEIATRFEQIFADSFGGSGKSTLAIICFTMGTWVGGMFTAACCRLLSQKGYPITLVTPGNNKAEIFRCVSELGPCFDQVVLLGYPPFLKDVIDSGRHAGVDWRARPVRLVFAGEVFSEEWRTLVGERVGIEDPCRGSASLYGTADAGVLGNETPLSIGLRRFFASRPNVARELFGESRLPTLVQYDPHSRFFEVEGGSLLFTGDGGVPLVRYQIGDSGGLVSFDSMMEFASRHGCKMSESGLPVRELPFVYVFGRSDFTVSYFGANIYPENVAVGLEQHPIPTWASGKFVLEVIEDEEHNRFLHVVVETLPGEDAGEDRIATTAESIRLQLERLNSEYAHYVPQGYRTPRVEFRPAGDSQYFPAGVKHRYTRRERSKQGDLS